MMAREEKAGFTLIELLVVIAIISLMSSIIFAPLNNARKKARDAKRVSDLHQIQLALEMFYSNYGFYPPERDQSFCGGWGNRSTSAATACGGNKWLTSDSNFDKYMPNVPVDPINNTWYAEDGSFTYTYTGGVSDYDLRALFEDPNNPNRCEKRCYKVHVFSVPGGSWCKNHPVGSPCGGTAWWDDASQPQLYADH